MSMNNDMDLYQENGLKTCPFCGGFVLFNDQFCNNLLDNHIITGECTQCQMRFEYQEKYEKVREYINNLNINPSLGAVHVDRVKRVNTSFKDAWNRRVN